MCMPMSKAYIYIIGVLSLLFSGCYHQEPETSDAWIVTEEQMDSISFYTTHHYTQNYNFLVTADSLSLIVQQPSELLSEMLVDTIVVHHEDRLVVADIMTLPSDTIDSVWVQVARDQMTIGWIREKEMLTGVAPDNPISQFIDFYDMGAGATNCKDCAFQRYPIVLSHASGPFRVCVSSVL